MFNYYSIHRFQYLVHQSDNLYDLTVTALAEYFNCVTLNYLTALLNIQKLIHKELALQYYILCKNGNILYKNLYK